MGGSEGEKNHRWGCEKGALAKERLGESCGEKKNVRRKAVAPNSKIRHGKEDTTPIGACGARKKKRKEADGTGSKDQGSWIYTERNWADKKVKKGTQKKADFHRSHRLSLGEKRRHEGRARERGVAGGQGEEN